MRFCAVEAVVLVALFVDFWSVKFSSSTGVLKEQDGIVVGVSWSLLLT